MKRPAYAKDVIERRRAGKRIELLQVLVHEWEPYDLAYLSMGKDRPELCKVVIPPDMDIREADLSCALALDCVVSGGVHETDFWRACEQLYAAGAASIWGFFDARYTSAEVRDPVSGRLFILHEPGFWRIERLYHAQPGFVCAEGPVPHHDLLDAVKRHRIASILLRDGVYGHALFEPARAHYLRGFLAGDDLMASA